MANGPLAALRQASRIGPQPSRAENLTGRAETARRERDLDESPSVFDSTWTKAKRALTGLGESIVDPSNWDRGAALPLEAITMVTKKPLTELLRRLAPRNATGAMLDPQEFPQLTQATQDIVERFPRVMSHAQSIQADLPAGGGQYGMFEVPNFLIHQLRRQKGAGDIYRQVNGLPVARIRVNPDIEQMAGKPAETLGHEANHLAGFIADPRSYLATMGKIENRFATDMLRNGKGLETSRSMGYHMDPAEISSRITGARHKARAMGDQVPTVAEQYRPSLAHDLVIDPHQMPDRDTMAQLWRAVRDSLRMAP